jgi:putative membrane protein
MLHCHLRPTQKPEGPQNEWGITHRIDQQIGALLMWVPACAVYLGAIMATLASWYRAPNVVRASFTTGG